MKNQGADYDSILMLLVFIACIAFLGPFWPSPKNIARWKEKAIFRPLVENPATLKYLLCYAFAALSFLEALLFYNNPTKEVLRLFKMAFEIAGADGVVFVWTFFALFSLVKGFDFHKDALDHKKVFEKKSPHR